MKALQSIINTLSTEEQHVFIQNLEQKNRRGDTKNVALFKLIASRKTENIVKKLYGKDAKNAYHALCKRLQDSLIDFIALKSFAGETSEEMEILKLLLSSRIFFEHKHYKLGFKTLAKAEKIALQLDVYSILTEIYHTKIQYAHLNASISLSEIIGAANNNLALFTREQQLNMAYAHIKEALKAKESKPIQDVITEAFGTFEIELDNKLTYKSLFQLMNITATAARLQSNYYDSAPFLFRLYEMVSEKEELANKHLFYHIEILNVMATVSFRNKDFKTSSKFLEIMEAQMEKEHRKYYGRFQEKLLLNKALCFNYTNQPNKAIELLQQYNANSLDIDLTLAVCYFQQEKYEDCYAVLKQMHHSDLWYEKKNGWIWVIKKSIIEILVLIELDKLDVVVSRISSFNNRFSKRLKASGEFRVLNFIKLVSKYYEAPQEINSLKFQQLVETSFEWIGTEKEDVFVMSFYAWLKAKMERTGLYETTLTLVRKN
ncbi:MAG: CDC27 family protein [Patiriisocius sp.]|uniref:CDC27 family protein n=1 Tax=Patiriisocius sp. TaxID=2822396 RepID=UPI003EF86141